MVMRCRRVKKMNEMRNSPPLSLQKEEIPCGLNRQERRWGRKRIFMKFYMFPGSEKLFRRNSTAARVGTKIYGNLKQPGSGEQISVVCARIHFLVAVCSGSKMHKKTGANAFCASLITDNAALRKGVERERRAHTDTSIRCKFNRLESSQHSLHLGFRKWDCDDKGKSKIYATLAEIQRHEQIISRARRARRMYDGCILFAFYTRR